ncbi:MULTISPECIES: glycosyltransferase family 4 protein [Pseudomonadota]|uniref:glycosyltransferase family 4 protein n=1 Tax=Pseudomonadota TaxID=1224 RepID=UPI003A93428E
MHILLTEWGLLTAFLTSACLSGILVATRSLHLKFTYRRKDVRAVQSAHTAPTPRIGGVAVLLGILFAGIPMTIGGEGQTWLLAVSLIPVFVAGFAEDLGFDVSPKRRLFAAALSSLLAIVLFGVWVMRTDVIGLDILVAFGPIGIALTVFGGAGICNAFNLIDGLNGLSGMIGITVAVALAFIADQGGNPELSTWGYMIASALAGFLLFNFPWGKIFMGDAGAYGVGHLLVWVAILMLNALPQLTPWALLLVFFWPLADTVLAIVRRRRNGKPTDQPDRLHFHQLVMRAIEIGKLGRSARHVANPLATVLMLPFFMAPPIVAVVFWDNAGASAVAFFCFAVLFTTSYSTCVLLARAWRKNSGRKFLYELVRQKMNILIPYTPEHKG